MNIFKKIWLAIISSNDEPYLKRIDELQKNNDSLNSELKELKKDFLECKKKSEEFYSELQKLQDKLKKETEEGKLESYWNNKRPKSDNYKYPARPPLTGTTNVDVDPRIFWQVYDKSYPVFKGSYDDIAKKAHDWVVKNIRYASDYAQFKKLEMWLFPFETIYFKKGDCEDGSILLANIMLRSGVPYWRIRLNAGFVRNPRNKDDKIGHAWVTYLRESDDKWVILDWSYWPNMSKNLSELWKSAEEYFSVWFSFNTKYVFKSDNLDR